jgi:hypothetical protein
MVRRMGIEEEAMIDNEEFMKIMNLERTEKTE